MARSIYWTGRAAMMVTVLLMTAGPAAAQSEDRVVVCSPNPAEPGGLVCKAVSGGRAVMERQVIVQASVGRPGRELAFLLLQNLEEEATTVSVEFVGPVTATRTYALAPKQRLAVNVAADVPELGASAFFSVIVYFPQDTAGAAEMVWHRVSDFAEVDNQVAVLRRSTKRLHPPTL